MHCSWLCIVVVHDSGSQGNILFTAGSANFFKVLQGHQETYVPTVVDVNAGGEAFCFRGWALCFKWRIRRREVGHNASNGGGIMLQVMNVGGGAFASEVGALCITWWIRTLVMRHYAADGQSRNCAHMRKNL